jgi:putative flippase GtrA
MKYATYKNLVLHKSVKELILYNKAVLVSFLATAVDISVMYLLNKQKNMQNQQNHRNQQSLIINDNMAIGISSLCGLLIQFIGQKYWTFKNESSSRHELIKQVAMFFTLEISLIICVILIFDHVYKYLSSKFDKIPKSWRESKLGTYIFKPQPHHQQGTQLNSQSQHQSQPELTEIGRILLKSCIVFFTFNLISYPLWRFVIFK